MVSLVDSRSGAQRLIPDRCIVGRSRACDLVLAARDVSSQHAELRWTGVHWELHDLGSRNGVTVDGVRLAAGARAIITPGSQIRFGHDSLWTVRDVEPPVLMAVHLTTGDTRAAEGGYLALPGPGEPVVCLYQESDGTWVCERGDESTVVDDRTVLPVGEALWRVHVPTAGTGTWQSDHTTLSIADLRLRLSYRRNEEYVEAVALHGQRTLDLQARAHHYVLLVLARQRLADRQAGAPDARQGWILLDDLSDRLRMDDNHINISIHRARTQLGQLGVVDAAALVERRRGTRQIRLGIREIDLVVLDETR